MSESNSVLTQEFPNVFHSCVVTRAQARKFEEELDLSDSFMCSDLSDVKDWFRHGDPKFELWAQMLTFLLTGST